MSGQEEALPACGIGLPGRLLWPRVTGSWLLCGDSVHFGLPAFASCPLDSCLSSPLVNPGGLWCRCMSIPSLPAGPGLAHFLRQRPVLTHPALPHAVETQLCQLFGFPQNSAPPKGIRPTGVMPCSQAGGQTHSRPPDTEFSQQSTVPRQADGGRVGREGMPVVQKQAVGGPLRPVRGHHAALGVGRTPRGRVN